MEVAREKAGRPAILISEEGLSRRVLTLAWPVVIEMTSTTFIGLVNLFMVGHLGTESLAAVGLAGQGYFLPLVLAMALGVGTAAIVSRHIGAGRTAEATLTLRQTMTLALILGAASVVGLWFAAEQMMSILRAKPDVVPLGAQYIRMAAFGTPLVCVMYAGNAALRAAGNTRAPMVIVFLMNIVNAIVGYLLIYGPFGLPELGVKGAGLAAGISYSFGGLMVLLLLRRGVSGLRFEFRKALGLDLGEIRRIVKVGLPAGMEQMSFQVAFTLYSIIIAGLGTQIYAAHTIALRVENIAFMPGFGFGVAASTLVGQSLGAGKPRVAERAASISQLYAMGLMSATAVVLFVFGRQLSMIFTSDPEVISKATMAMRIYAFSMPFMGTSNTMAGALRGAGDTRTVLILMAACAWGIRIPVAFLATNVFSWGAAGAWWAAVADLSVRGLLMWLLFRRGRWKTIRV